MEYKWNIFILSIFKDLLFSHVAAQMTFTMQTSNHLRCEQLCRYQGGCRSVIFKHKVCTMFLNKSFLSENLINRTLNSNSICIGNICGASQLCIPKMSYPTYSCKDTHQDQVNETQITTQSHTSIVDSTPPMTSTSTSDPASPISQAMDFPSTPIQTSDSASQHLTPTSAPVSTTSPLPTLTSVSTSSPLSSPVSISFTDLTPTSETTSTGSQSPTPVSTPSLTSIPEPFPSTTPAQITGGSYSSTPTQGVFQVYVYPVLKTWEEAKEACNVVGRKLAIIGNNDAWQSTVADILVVDNYQTMRGFWLDGRDDVINGEWVTWDDSVIPWTIWSGGQPDTTDEHCVEMNRGMGFKMNDKGCGDKKGYLCQ